jgi:A nuclease of the HNH/ENDO VII superfamily with conserved WHH
MPGRTSPTRSQELRYRDEAVATAPARAVGKETRVGSPEESSPLAPFPRTRLGSAREPWAESDVTEALGLSTDQEHAPAAPALDARAAASPAEMQLARSLVQLGLAHLQILQTTLLEAYHRAVFATDPPAVRDLALQLVNEIAQVEHARDQISPGDDLEPLRTELDAAWQQTVALLTVQMSPQVLGGASVAAALEPPSRAHVVHLGAELVAREAGRVLELLEAAERIRSYVMPEESSTSLPAEPGDQLLAVAELARFASRPVDALFLVALLRRTGVWTELAQARGADGRTAAQVLGAASAQAAETGATVELGPRWDVQEAVEALSYGLTDWAVTDEDAARVVEMLQEASPQGRGALVKQLHRLGLLERLAANVGWSFLQQLGETLNDPAAEALLAPHYEGKGGVPSSHQLFMEQVDRNLEEGSALDTLQAGAWYTLDAGLDTLSFGGKSSIDRAHEARDAGLISDDAYWAEANKAMARTAAIGTAAALTGGTAGAWSEGAALALGAGEGGAALVGGAVGGAVGNVGGRFIGDVYDQLLSGKQGFDSFSTYAQDFATGGLFGTALAPLGLHAAKHLPASARTLAQAYAVRHPHLIPMLEAARAAGTGTAFRVRMTVREWLDVLRTGAGGPPGATGGFGGGHPAFAAGDGVVASAAAIPPDLHSLPPDVELWITARPTVDLDAPMARLDEDEPWFEAEGVENATGPRKHSSAFERDDVWAPDKLSLGEGPDVEHLQVREAPPKIHSPAEGTDRGWWEGDRANSAFHSYDPSILAITGGQPVEYRNGYPDLRPYARGRVFLLKKEMKGRYSDMRAADRIFARKQGWLVDGQPSATKAKDYRSREKLTWHHVEGVDGATPEELLLVPDNLHRYLPHEGGATQARAAVVSKSLPEGGR